MRKSDPDPVYGSYRDPYSVEYWSRVANLTTASRWVTGCLTELVNVLVGPAHIRLTDKCNGSVRV